MDQQQTNPITLPIKWVIPDSIKTDHATHLVIQQHGSEFILLFFELQLPLTVGTPEEQMVALKELTFTEAKCISKLVVSAENVTQMTSHLIESLNRFQANLQGMVKGQEDANASEHSELSITG